MKIFTASLVLVCFITLSRGISAPTTQPASSAAIGQTTKASQQSTIPSNAIITSPPPIKPFQEVYFKIDGVFSQVPVTSTAQPTTEVSQTTSTVTESPTPPPDTSTTTTTTATTTTTTTTTTAPPPPQTTTSATAKPTESTPGDELSFELEGVISLSPKDFITQPVAGATQVAPTAASATEKVQLGVTNGSINGLSVSEAEHGASTSNKPVKVTRNYRTTKKVARITTTIGEEDNKNEEQEVSSEGNDEVTQEETAERDLENSSKGKHKPTEAQPTAEDIEESPVYNTRTAVTLEQPNDEKKLEELADVKTKELPKRSTITTEKMDEIIESIIEEREETLKHTTEDHGLAILRHEEQELNGKLMKILGKMEGNSTDTGDENIMNGNGFTEAGENIQSSEAFDLFTEDPLPTDFDMPYLPDLND